MPQFKKWGKHIRASDKSLVFRFSAGSLLLLFLAMIILLNLKAIVTTDWESVSFLQDGSVHFSVTPYRIVTVIVSALVCVIAAFLYQRFQYDRVKQLFHRQKLAKMILENGWYESETTQESGFFKDLPASSKKEKITYFPKLYYRMDNGLLYIRTEITLGKYQDQLLHLEKKLETGLYCELGDVFVLTSPDKEKGTLLELKGKGCRQMESYLLAQHRSWYDFLMDALIEGGVMKRLDLAINDMAGILDIPELTEKCNHEECISVFRSFKSYRSGELVRSNEQDRYGMGNTLYIGSLKSEVYFCIYEKDYEQYAKYDIAIEDTKIKNRFEIRLKNERAYYAVRDLLTYHDAERTAFDIINRYIRFADKEVEKRRSEWKTNEKWAYFIGSDRGRLKLTTKPEPYTLTRTLNWISRQVAPTWKVLQQIDSTNGTTYLKDILDHAKLTERHKKLIEQQTTSTEEIINKEE